VQRILEKEKIQRKNGSGRKKKIGIKGIRFALTILSNTIHFSLLRIFKSF